MAFPGTGSIQYLIDPAYYAAVVAGTTLAGYTTWGVSTYTTSVSTDTLGSTGWSIRVYSDGGTSKATFVWNSTTKEVIFFVPTTSTHYWDADDVLASFATDAETSFFAAIGKTRSSLYATAPSSTAVGGAVSGWSAYHDSLVEQLQSIQDRYGWQDDAALVARVDAIQAELLAAGSTLVNSPLSAMLDDFDRAYEESKQSNLERYEQLIAEASTTSLPSPYVVMSYPQLALHLDSAHFEPIVTDLETLVQEQLTVDQEVLDALPSDYETISEEIDRIGDRAREDIAEAYRAKLSEAMQGLVDTGMYNSILGAAATSGMAQAEANDLARLNDEIGKMKVQVLSANMSLRAQERRTQANNRLSSSRATMDWRVDRAKTLATIYQMGAAIVEGRTDVGPALSDIANLTMNIGRGQGAQQMLGAFQPQQIVQTGGGFDFSGFLQKAIAGKTGEKT